jgi:hypothetical protein
MILMLKGWFLYQKNVIGLNPMKDGIMRIVNDLEE